MTRSSSASVWRRAYRELAETRAKVPRDVRQVAFDQPPAPVASDPLARLFAAIAPPKQ
jgi:hypothetical protein